jgi:hypothetical protein
MTLGRLMLGVAVVAAMNSVTGADIFTFDGSNSTDFNDPENWDQNAVPDDGDRIVIPADKLCEVMADGETTEFTVDTFEIQSDPNGILTPGDLRINPGITLIVENDDKNITCNPPPAPSCAQYDAYLVNGTVTLASQGGSAGTLVFTSSALHVIGGEGEIVGQIGAVVSIDADVVVRNALDVESGGFFGDMLIDGVEGTGGSADGAFDNFGRVEAGTLQIIQLSYTTLVGDAEGALWKTDDCGKLQFDADAPDLLGDFALGDCGNLEINAWVRTCGTLSVTYNELQLDCSYNIVIGPYSGAVFEYVTFSPSGCDNPADVVPEDPDCAKIRSRLHTRMVRASASRR